MPKETIKKILFSTSLIIFCIIFVLLFSEILLRVVLSNKFMSRDRFIVSQYEEIDYEYKPNFNSYCDSIKNVLKINSEGFRDKEFSLEKQQNTKRIVCIGDSATFGHGIKNIDDILSRQLEKQLNKTSKNKFEVYNMGVEGYNTNHHLGVLKHKALKYSPDIVILVFNFGDVGPDWMISKNGVVVNQMFYPPVLRKCLPNSISNFLMNNSVLFYYLEFIVSSNLYLSKHKALDVSKLCKKGNENEDFNLKKLLEIKQQSYKNNVKLVVAIMPWLSEPIDKSSPEIPKLKRLISTLKENNINYIDLFEPILYENNNSKLDIEEYTDSLKVSKLDGHPNEKALEIYAKEIKNKLSGLGLIE